MLSDLTSAEKPQQFLSKIDVMKLVTETDNDRACTKERCKGIIAHMICEFLPAFHHFKNTASNNSICKYDQDEMQSIVVPFPVMIKDEKKYVELVDVLDKLRIMDSRTLFESQTLSITQSL